MRSSTPFLVVTAFSRIVPKKPGPYNGSSRTALCKEVRKNMKLGSVGPSRVKG